MENKILLIGGSGYVGSYLYKHLIRNGYGVDICDSGKRGHPSGFVKFPIDYNDLTTQDLSFYSIVLWFAGHSSVTSALDDPFGALTNNCINLVGLRQRMRPEARIVYASTASLYSENPNISDKNTPSSQEDEIIVPGLNHYDMSKFCFDYISNNFISNFIGLRMGTVSGFSPNIRKELIFNAMNLSAIHTGRIKLANPTASRSILFLDDLYRVVEECIRNSEIPDGFLNVASASATVGEIAEIVARFHDAVIDELPNSPTYSFRLNTEKATRQLGVRFNGDLTVRCREFLETIKGDSLL